MIATPVWPAAHSRAHARASVSSRKQTRVFGLIQSPPPWFYVGTPFRKSNFWLNFFTKMGLILHTVEKRRSSISFNSAHPIFRSLRAYLVRLQGVGSDRAPIHSKERMATYSVDALFGTKLRLGVLVMLYLAGDEGIDGTDMARLLPQHPDAKPDRQGLGLLRAWNSHRRADGFWNDTIPVQYGLRMLP